MKKLVAMVVASGALMACGGGETGVLAGHAWIKTGCADVASAERTTCANGQDFDAEVVLDDDGFGQRIVDEKEMDVEVRPILDEEGAEVGLELCEVTTWEGRFVFKSCGRVFVRSDKMFDFCKIAPCERYERI